MPDCPTNPNTGDPAGILKKNPALLGKGVKVEVCDGDCDPKKPKEKCTVYFKIQKGPNGCQALCACVERTPPEPPNDNPDKFQPPEGWKTADIKYEKPLPIPGKKGQSESCKVEAQLNDAKDGLYVWCKETRPCGGTQKCLPYYWEEFDLANKIYTLHVGCGCA